MRRLAATSCLLLVPVVACGGALDLGDAESTLGLELDGDASDEDSDSDSDSDSDRDSDGESAGDEASSDGDGGCTLTKGYWKNHEESWPVDELTLGGVSYDEAELMAILGSQGGDASMILGSQLVAARLNVAAGAGDAAVATAFTDADAWLAANADGDGKLPFGVDPSSEAGQAGVALARTLDEYNNGIVGPGHCDDGPPSSGEGEGEGEGDGDEDPGEGEGEGEGDENPGEGEGEGEGDEDPGEGEGEGEGEGDDGAGASDPACYDPESSSYVC